MRNQIPMLSALRWGLLGLALVLAGTGGPVARGATLRWKFKPGETLHYAMDQKTVTTAKLPGGQEIKTTLNQTIEMSWAVKGVDEGGTTELVQTIDRIRDQVEAPVGSYVYDSNEPKEPEGLVAAARVPLFKALLGVPIAFKMSALGEPGGVRMPDKVAQALRDLGPAAAGAGAMFSEEGLKEMITQASLILPQDDLAEGKSWTRQTKNVIPPIGTMVIDSTYRYEGPAPDAGPNAVKIGLVTKVEIQAAEADPNAGGLKIRSQKSQGTYNFDNSAGHVLDSNLIEVIDVGATLKIGQGAAARDMELNQTTETTTRRKLVKDEQAAPSR
jgi:hypothetical protein